MRYAGRPGASRRAVWVVIPRLRQRSPRARPCRTGAGQLPCVAIGGGPCTYHMGSGMWLTIPNLLTLVRIIMTPFILIELSKGRYLAGGWMFGAAAFTDVLDGGLARLLGSQSKVGQYFDPIADKVLLSCIYIGLAMGRAVPLWI